MKKKYIKPELDITENNIDNDILITSHNYRPDKPDIPSDHHDPHDPHDHHYFIFGNETKQEENIFTFDE